MSTQPGDQPTPTGSAGLFREAVKPDDPSHPNPFEDDPAMGWRNSHSYSVDKDIDPAAFGDQLSKRVGEQVRCVISWHDETHEVGVSKPLILFVSPADIRPRDVLAAVASYTPPEPVTASQDSQDSGPALNGMAELLNHPELAEVKSKLEAGDKLTTSNMTDVFRVLFNVQA